MQVITSRIDFADGVFIGGGNPTIFLTPTAQSSMTTSFVDAAVSQELQLSDLQNISGGIPALWAILGAEAALAADLLLEHHTGKGIGEHFSDAVEGAYEWATSEDECSVAPTKDGKGCTDRDLPM